MATNPITPLSTAGTGTTSTGQSVAAANSVTGNYGIVAGQTAAQANVASGDVAGSPGATNQAPSGVDANGQPIYPGGTGAAGSPSPGPAPTPPQTEDQIRAQMLAEAQSQIDAINQQFSATIAQDTSQAQADQTNVNASAARMGLMGSPAGGAMLSTAAQKSDQVIAADRAQQATAIASVYATVDSNALAQANLEKEQAVTDATTYLQNQQSIAAQALKSAQSFAATGITGSQLQQQDPQTYQQLLTQTGYTPYQLDAAIQAAIPTQYQPTAQTSYASTPDGKSTVMTVTYTQVNPQTGKSSVSTQQYTLPMPFQSVDQQGMITDSKTGQLLMPQIQPDGSTVYVPVSPTLLNQGQIETGSGLGNTVYGEPKTTSVAFGATPVTSGPTATQGNAPIAQTPSSQSGTPATAPSTPSDFSAPKTSPTPNGFGALAPASQPTSTTGASQPSSAQVGQQVWSSLPVQTQKMLTTIGQTPQTLVLSAWQSILSGSTASSGGMSPLNQLSPNTIKQITSAILASYGNNPDGTPILTAQDLPAIQSLAEANQTAVGNLVTQAASVGQYIKKSQVSLNNLSVAISNYGENTVSPAVNLVIQWFQNNVDNNQNLTGYAAQLQNFLYDYGKVMSGATASKAGITVSSAADAAKVLNTYMSQGSVGQALNYMNADMNGQVSSIQDQTVSTLGNITNAVQTYIQDKQSPSFMGNNSGGSDVVTGISNMLATQGVPTTQINQFAQMANNAGVDQTDLQSQIQQYGWQQVYDYLNNNQ